MRVSVEIPEPKANGLDTVLAKQFADIQRQLLGMVKEQSESKHTMHTLMMESLQEQREGLLKAMERLLGMVGKAIESAQPSDALADALKGIKQVMADLPGDLRDALETQYRTLQTKLLPKETTSHVTVKMPQGLTDRLDALHEAMVNGLKHSRNRTFGSNY